MKATTLNTYFCILADVALIGNAAFDGLDVLSLTGSIVGYTLLCLGAWLFINHIIEKGGAQ